MPARKVSERNYARLVANHFDNVAAELLVLEREEQRRAYKAEWMRVHRLTHPEKAKAQHREAWYRRKLKGA